MFILYLELAHPSIGFLFPLGMLLSEQFFVSGLSCSAFIKLYTFSNVATVQQNTCSRSTFQFFFGGGVGTVGGLDMCHPLYHPLDFQGKIQNFCHSTLPKTKFKITVKPPPQKNKKTKKQKQTSKVKITVLQ